MAKKFLTDIDLNGNKLRNATVDNAEAGKILKIGNDGKIIAGDAPETYTIDTNNNQLIVSAGNDRYFASLTKLTKPNTPTIANAQLAKSVVTGSAEIAVSGIDSGATAYYKIADTVAGLANASYVAISGSKFSIDSSFDNASDNAAFSKFVILKAVKNGVDSDATAEPYEIVITPKVATPALSASNTDQYEATATVTISKSATTGATTEYKVGDGDWTELTENSKTITVSANKAAGEYKVRATKTGHAASDTNQSQAIVVNKKKAYYGFSTATALANAADIAALGNSVKSNKLSGAYVITPSGNANGYVWLCCEGTLDTNKIVPNQGDVIPFGFEAAIVVDGWNCYRSTNDIEPISNINVYVG
jgi:hypothetical protein